MKIYIKKNLLFYIYNIKTALKPIYIVEIASFIVNKNNLY